jgi:hypothetical protein
VALVEPVGVRPPDVGGELDPVTTGLLGCVDSSVQELPTDASSAEVWIDVHGFHLRAEAASPLEVTEHHELAHSDDLAVGLSDEESVAGRQDLSQGRCIRGEVGGVFLPLFKGTVLEEPNQTLDVV